MVSSYIVIYAFLQSLHCLFLPGNDVLVARVTRHNVAPPHFFYGSLVQYQTTLGGGLPIFHPRNSSYFHLTLYLCQSKSTAMAASDWHLFSPNTDFSQILAVSDSVIHLLKTSLKSVMQRLIVSILRIRCRRHPRHCDASHSLHRRSLIFVPENL
jgi:hypothetical protein